jgi:hypothetical protein
MHLKRRNINIAIYNIDVWKNETKLQTDKRASMLLLLHAKNKKKTRLFT